MIKNTKKTGINAIKNLYFFKHFLAEHKTEIIN